MKRTPDKVGRNRLAREASGKVMWALKGNLPGFEEASRALSRGDLEHFAALISAWPLDIREYLFRLSNST